jgi:hypothetical protein
MKNTMIFAGAIVVLIGVVYIAIWLSFNKNGRNWLNDRGSTLAAKCKTVNFGDSIETVVQKMGEADTRTESDGVTVLLYLRGGLISDKGLTFEFKGNKLIKTNCQK